MSKITLYTPNTGLPDLELKIAYGLCRVAFEAGLEFVMRPRQGWWEIEVESEKLTEEGVRERFKESFAGLVMKMLGFEEGFTKIPAGRDIKMRQSKPQEFFGKADLAKDHISHDGKIIYEQPHELIRSDWPLGVGKGNYFMCNHANIPEFKGAGVPAIAFVARAWGRNKPFGDSLPGLCKLCGWLSFIGYHSGFPVLATDKEHKVVLELIPKVPVVNRVENEGGAIHFAEILSLHKTLKASESSLPKGVASAAIPLLLLSAYPTLLGFLWNMGSETGTTEDEKAWFDFKFWFWFEGQASQIKDATADSTEAYRNFLIDQKKRLPNPYNLALLKRLAEAKQQKGGCILVYPVEHLWPLLVKALTHPSVEERRRLTLDFLRGVAIGLRKKGQNQPAYLISRKTAKTFLEVVMSIKNKELFDQTTDQGKAVEAVAGVLRCFVEERDFGLLNRLIGLSSSNFLEFLVQLNRTGQAIATGRTEKGGVMFIPTEKGDRVKHFMPSKDQIDLLVQLASRDDEGFKEVKNAIAVSALSNWPWIKHEEQTEEITEEPEEKEVEDERE